MVRSSSEFIRPDPLFPYTTLFRALRLAQQALRRTRRAAGDHRTGARGRHAAADRAGAGDAVAVPGVLRRAVHAARRARPGLPAGPLTGLYPVPLRPVA